MILTRRCNAKTNVAIVFSIMSYYSKRNRSCYNSEQAWHIFKITVAKNRASMPRVIFGFWMIWSIHCTIVSRVWTVQTRDASLCRSLCCFNWLNVTKLPAGTCWSPATWCMMDTSSYTHASFRDKTLMNFSKSIFWSTMYLFTQSCLEAPFEAQQKQYTVSTGIAVRRVGPLPALFGVPCPMSWKRQRNHWITVSKTRI